MQVLVRMSKTIGFRASGLQLTPRAVQVSCCEPQGLRCFCVGYAVSVHAALVRGGGIWHHKVLDPYTYPRETPASRPFSANVHTLVLRYLVAGDSG